MEVNSGSTSVVSMTPLELRDAMTKSLKRTLFGPAESSDMSWFTQRSPIVIDSNFQPENERPIGPFVSDTGQEILPFRPVNLYVAGILFPPDVDVIGAQSDEEAEEALVDPARESSKSEAVDEGSEDEAEEEVLLSGQLARGRTRSMAVSFRVVESVERAELILMFGSYEAVAVAGQHQNWWQRFPHELRIGISTSESIDRMIEVDGFHVRLSCLSRPSREGDRLCTVSVSNETNASVAGGSEMARCMFQTKLQVDVGGLLPYAPERRNRESVDLLYRNVRHLAVGHGCDVSVESSGQAGFTIRTESVPTVDVLAAVPSVYGADGTEMSIGMSDLAEFTDIAKAQINELISLYESWISDHSSAAERLNQSDAALGRQQLSEWQNFLNDVRQGWQLIQANPEAQRCFRDANSAMYFQRVASSRGLRQATISDNGEVAYDPVNISAQIVPAWRPFQIAFILASLPKVVDPDSSARQWVDVIWMPTGGGKTEAYLGLAAFTILWERFHIVVNPQWRSQQTTKVLMRYTLQLLTVQQLIRSASLICALEIIRAENEERYGQSEVRLGAWVGSKLTPNTRQDALKRLTEAEGKKTGVSSGFLLSQCPWCGAQMGFAVKRKVAGYSRVNLPGPKKQARLLAHCPDATCRFSRRQETIRGDVRERGLPILETDEDLYAFPPDFVIGTVDKVATMAIAPGAQRLFGLKDGSRIAPAPALFIQDELHLISGPLGSLDGVFELMLELLCVAGAGGRAPVYVAATATTRNFQSQIRGLYGRESRLVPPPGIDIEDSFFSRQDPSRPTRRYVALSSSGGISASEVQLRVLASLAHFAGVFKSFSINADPYWTDVSFFSSRRALGMLTSSVETKLRGFADKIRLASGSSGGELDKDGQRNRRGVKRPREITATGSENVSEVLADLARTYDDPKCVDLCFATSMIEVGLDVPRLGLMTVIGQPKGSSQYIQVTGRVGRSDKAPALVIDVLSSSSPRDRSHYESFIGWHERLYASVESASVTPFTRQALERSCPTTIAALVQILEGARGGTIPDQVRRIWPRIETLYLDRASQHGSWESETTKKVLAELFAQASVPAVATYGWRDSNTTPGFLQLASEVDSASRPNGVWRILTSMRSVDPDAPAQMLANVRGSTETRVDQNSTTIPAEYEEEQL